MDPIDIKKLRDEIMGENFGDLPQAQQSAADSASRAGWMRVGDRIAAAFGGTRPDYTAADAIEQRGRQGVNDALKMGQLRHEATGEAREVAAAQKQADRDAELDDPNSATTGAYRDFYKSAAPNLDTSKMNARQMQFIAPGLNEQIKLKAEQARLQQQQEFQHGENEANREMGKFTHFATPGGDIYTENGKNGAIQKVVSGAAPSPDGTANPLAGLKPEQMQKLWTEFGNTLSTVRGKANANVQQQQRLNALDRLQGLMTKGLGPEGMTPQEQALLDTDLASVYAGGGSPAQSQIEHMHAGTWKGSLAKTMQWALNSPQDVGAQAFLKRTQGNADELRKTISRQMLEGQEQSLPRYIGLRRANAKQFDSMLKAAHVDPSVIDPETGLVVPAATAAGGGGAAPKTIRVSNGKETLEIDPADLPHAMLDHYKVVP